MGRQIPWGRLGAEGTVILASILLAFAVQAWWEGREDRRQEVEHLTALRAELAEGLRRIPEARQSVTDVLHSHEALASQFEGDGLAPSDSLVYWLSNVSWPANFVPPGSVLNDLLSSGGIQRITSDPLRISIADYQTVLGAYLLYVDLAWAIWSDRIQPYLEGRVPRVDRLLRGSYPAPDRRVPFAPSRFTPDYPSIFNDPAFESMIAERWMRLNEAGRLLDAIASSMETLLALIEADLAPGLP